MEEKMKGKRSKYSGKQKTAIEEALSSNKVYDYNLPVEEVFEMPFGKALLPERGFQQLYSVVNEGGESCHILADSSEPYFFALC